MRRTLTTAAMAGMLAFAAGATDAEAQAQDDGWWQWALPQVAQAAQQEGGLSLPEILERARRGEASRRRGEPRRDERDRGYEDEREWEDEDGRRGPPHARGERGRRGNGPPFCRSGQGHPVHGWQRCVDKGWAGQGVYQGRHQDRRDGGWLPTRWEDVIIGSPTPRRTEQRVAQPTLADILGGVIMGRLAGHGDRIGATGDFSGRWLLENGARILQVRAGDRPLAELTDLDGDGRADVVLLARGR